MAYDNIAIREKGDVFDMPEGSSGPWFKPYNGAVAADPKNSEAPAKPASDVRYLD